MKAKERQQRQQREKATPSGNNAYRVAQQPQTNVVMTEERLKNSCMIVKADKLDKGCIAVFMADINLVFEVAFVQLKCPCHLNHY